MEIWWRSAALEALQAYMATVLPQAPRSQNARLQRLLGSLLQPSLDAVFASPALQVTPAFGQEPGCCKPPPSNVASWLVFAVACVHLDS